MKKVIMDYTFIPASKQIVFTGAVRPTVLHQILLITNVNTNTPVYNPFVIGKGGDLVDNILTLDTDTTTMNANDILQIFADINSPEYREELAPLEVHYSYDVNMENVLGTTSIRDNQGRVVTTTQNPVLETKQTKITTAGQVFVIDCNDASQVLVQFAQPVGSATLNGAMYFEITLDGTNWHNIEGWSQTALQYRNGQYWDTGTYGAGASVWRLQVAGFKQFRVRCNALSAGFIDVIMKTLTTPWVQPLHVNKRSYGGELAVAEANLAGILGTAEVTPINTLFNPANPVRVLPPTINPSQPSSFASPLFYKYPQRMNRLRVQAGGSEMLPFAQEPYTNELKVSYPALYNLIEELLMHVKMLNINYAVTNNATLPKGVDDEIR